MSPVSEPGQSSPLAIQEPGEDDSPVLHFPAGIVGFPALQDYLLARLPSADDDDPGSIYLLTSVRESSLRFAVADPAPFFPDYEPVLDDETVELLGLTSAEDALLLVVLTVGQRPEDATANLLAPLVIHRGTRRGLQAVLTGSPWRLREPLAAQAA